MVARTRGVACRHGCGYAFGMAVGVWRRESTVREARELGDRAESAWHNAHDAKGAAEALSLALKAIDADPAWSHPYVLASTITRLRALRGWAEPHDAECRAALALAEKGVVLDPNAAEAHNARALALLDLGELATAEREFKAAIALSPTTAESHAHYAQLFVARGKPLKALALVRRAKELSPRPHPWQSTLEAIALMMLGLFEEARATLDAAVEANPTVVAAWALRAVAAAALGYGSEAEASLSMVFAREPGFQPSRWLSSFRFLNDETRKTIEEGLRKAGL